MNLKTPHEVEIMHQGGQKLSNVKKKVLGVIAPNVSAWDIEELVTREIKAQGGKSSFKMVPGYSWSTCVNINDGVVHGIPKKETIFKKGDLVSVDMGMCYQGFHTDTSISVYLGDDPKVQKFMEVGKRSLKQGIKAFKKGNTVADITQAMLTELVRANYSPVYNLTGHGVGRKLHEDPRVPMVLSGSRDERVKLEPGLVLAIEVMYAMGKGDIVLEDDGWTLSTQDGTISALFEETVALTGHGRVILT